MLNKIFIGVKRDGGYEVYRSMYAPKGKKYRTVIQVEFENMFEPASRTFSCRVESGIVTDQALYDFINEWVDTHILVDPTDVELKSEVYYIKNPNNVFAGSGCVLVVTGDGEITADDSFQIVAYENVKIYRKSPLRVDAWNNVTLHNLY